MTKLSSKGDPRAAKAPQGTTVVFQLSANGFYPIRPPKLDKIRSKLSESLKQLQSFQKPSNVDAMKPPLFASELLFLLALLFHASAGQAAGFGELGVHVTTERAEDNGTTGITATSERHFRVDVASGWRSEVSEIQSIGYGLVFKTERGLQTGSELAGYGLGAFVGWYAGPFSLRFDYLLVSELKANNGFVETQYREGNGYSLEARWLHWLEPSETGHRLGLGPALAFTQMKYGKTRVGSLPESSATRATETLAPGIRAIYIF